ncbi:MAG: alkyl hydroperoxide reductase [Flavipsychrobacter sp.]|jgi:peroxiredoxin (alkyl hydroperoxide reductase subunit C)|nr:alkyl hydroperoxide reductase [Flavipsychrobacter sp.]
MANSFVTVGDRFPQFEKKAVVSIEKGKEFKTVSNKDIEGRWAVMFWWPKDFTFVCPTEIAEFNKNYTNFKDRETVLLGASTDNEYVHHAWRVHHKDLTDLKYPMIADTSRSLAEELGILSAEEKVAYRATYIIDTEGIVRWLSINDLSVGRNVAEVLRVLDALQTDELCPCNWNKGQETIDAPVG